ncbi:MAG: glycosyltransferase family 2 protein, partial [Thaumarchaeota archaeon]|nr:glycosyltransferase family 2 protein [Nitrososphaerota archaeon]
VSMKDKLTDSQSGFRAYNKKVLSTLSPADHGMGISTEILIKASSVGFRIVEVPIKVLYEGNTSTHHSISHGTSVLFSTIKYTSIEHPLKFYGIPALIFISIGLAFTFLSVQYYSDVGRINTNLTLIAAGTILIGIVLIIAAILLYSLVSVVRERHDQ